VTVQVQVLVKLLPLIVPVQAVFFISYDLLSQLLAVTVDVIVHVSLPDTDRDNDAEHDGGPDEPPPPPPPPVGVDLGSNTLNAELKNDAIELNIDEKKLVTSWNDRA
jgi:hypothetical protein